MFQFGNLVPELTAADNVALPLLLKREEAEAAYPAGREVAGQARAGRRRRPGAPGELSGGEVPAGSCRAGAGRWSRRLLFADEPTGSLDSLTGEKVMKLLVGLAREQGVTVVIVTHDVRVAAYADREVMVRDGVVTVDAGRVRA